MSNLLPLRDGTFPTYAINRSECIRQMLSLLGQKTSNHNVVRAVSSRFGIKVTSELVSKVRGKTYGTRRVNYSAKRITVVRNLVKEIGWKEVVKLVMQEVS